MPVLFWVGDFDIIAWMSESVEESIQNVKPTLAELLPQASPMLLLTGYEEPSEEGAVKAYVDVSADSPFFDPEGGGVPGCVALEYMAQAMALCVGLVRRRQGLPPQVGFLLGSRCFEVLVAFFCPGRRYGVRANCIYQDGEMGSFDCQVLDSEGHIAARATLMAYLPPEEMTLEKLKEFA